MPLKPAPILISDAVYQILSKLTRSRTLPARQVERAKIFMLCADGLNNLQISERVSIGQDSVSKWRTRFLNILSRLQEVKKQHPTELESEVTALLSDYTRPGQPPTYTDEQIIRILETACRNPEEYGYEASHWSLNLETFTEKVNAICTIYHNAVPASKHGAHTISVDEMTGIQALEHKYPDKPVIPGKTTRMEFEYIRHRTTSLIGFFDIATGRMEKPYLNKTCTEDDFVEAVRKLVETDPNTSWIFVCDGLNIHR